LTGVESRSSFGWPSRWMFNVMVRSLSLLMGLNPGLELFYLVFPLKIKSR